MEFNDEHLGAWIVAGVLFSPFLFWVSIQLGKAIYLWLH